jgi:hypothetical protein
MDSMQNVMRFWHEDLVETQQTVGHKFIAIL